MPKTNCVLQLICTWQKIQHFCWNVSWCDIPGKSTYVQRI